MEPLEPRLLLSADPAGASLAMQAALDTHSLSAALWRSAAGPDADLHSQLELVPVASDAFGAQNIVLDLDGARDARYDGPVSADKIEIPKFRAPEHLAGQEDAIVASMLEALEGRYGPNVVFGTDVPAGEPYSTVHVGGRGEGFPSRGYLGLAESIDPGNRDPWDEAFVFSELVPSAGQTAMEFGRSLADVVAHEAGHLLGLSHAHEEPNSQDPLAEVAFKPYTHVQIARGVLDDILADQKVTIEDESYAVHPLILQALQEHQDYYFGGTVGPDGFPDVLFGQAVIHGEDTGTWLTRIMDMAWSIQDGSAFSAPEKSQVLAWAYGFLTHAAGDLWAHSLVDEFAEGVFPSLKDAVGGVLDGGRELANAVRHLLVEGYIADATPGFDNNPGRSDVPDPDGGASKDVSDDSTPAIPFAVPSRFVYETLIKPFPGDPTRLADTGAPRLIGESPAIRVARTTGDAPRQAFQRDTGSFVGDGFKIGQKVVTEGFATNGIYYVREVSDKLLELEDGAAMPEEDPADLRGDERLFVEVPETRKLDLKADEDQRALVRDVGSFKADGFTVGQRVAVYGFSSPDGPPSANDGLYRVVEVSGKRLVVDRPLVEEEGNGDEQIVAQGGRGFVIDQLLSLQDRILTATKGRPRRDLGELLGKVLNLLADGAQLNDAKALLPDLKDAYLYSWADAIEEGLQHWGDLGLAFTRAFFDPQARRDLQNDERDGFPEESHTAIRREESVGLADVFFELLDDPDRDGFSEDSFINNYFLPMLGVPRELAFVRTALDALGSFASDIAAPLRDFAGLVIDPIRGAFSDLKEVAETFLKQQIERRFGIPFEAIEFLTDAEAKLDLASIEVGGHVLPIFKAGDHERLDSYLGLPPGSSEDAPAGLHSLSIPGFGFNFFDDARGRLKDTANFNERAFAAYDNSLQLSKMLLLLETNPVASDDGGSSGGLSTLMSHVLTGLSGTEQTYDFSKLNLNGAHGGNILTATLPGVDDGRPWLLSIDTDHVWRADSLTALAALFRVNTRGAGDRPAVYRANVTPGSYRLYATWLANITQDVDNLAGSASPDQKIRPATNARYRIYDGFESKDPIGEISIDQSVFPSGADGGPDPDLQADGLPYRELRTVSGAPGGPAQVGPFLIHTGELRIEIESAADGNVLAGPIRFAPADPGVGGSSGVIQFSQGTDRTLHFDTGSSQIQSSDFERLDALAAMLKKGGNEGLTVEIAGHTDAQGAERSNQELSRARAAAVRQALIARGVESGRLRIVAYGEDRPLVPNSPTGEAAENRRVELVVKTGWEDLRYPTGARRFGEATGVFPLWESETLRPVFRKVFTDWQNGALQFPALGDETSPDPNTSGRKSDPVLSLATPILRPAPPQALVIPIKENLKAKILKGIDSLGDAAGELSQLELLNRRLPLINKSVNEIFDFQAQVEEQVQKPIRGYLGDDGASGIHRDLSPTFNELLGPAAIRSLRHRDSFVKLDEDMGDAVFTIAVAGRSTTVTLSEAATSKNNHPKDLVADLNDALDGTELAQRIAVRLDRVEGGDDYQLVLEAVDPSVTRFDLVAEATNAAALQLGFSSGPGSAFGRRFDLPGRIELERRGEESFRFESEFGKPYGIELSSVAVLHYDVEAELDFSFSLPSASFQIHDFALSLDAAVDPLNTRMRIGALGASIVNGYVDVQASLALAQSGPISLTQLPSAPFEFSGSLDARLPIHVALGKAELTKELPTLVIRSNDLFGKAPEVRFESDQKDVDLAALWKRLRDFNRLDAAGMVAALGQLSSFLESVRQSPVVASLQVPLVKGALDKVLDLAEVFSDAVLYDEGADGVIDGADALVTDVNDALAEADLDDQILAVAEGDRLVFQAIDSSIVEFSISKAGAAVYGFEDGQVAEGRFLEARVPAAVGATAAFALTITREVRSSRDPNEKPKRVQEEAIDVVVGEEAVRSNQRLGDDVPKLVNRSNGALFRDVQGLANRLSDIGADGLLGYDLATKQLTYDLSIKDAHFLDVQLPSDFALDLGSLAGISSLSKIVLDAKGDLRLRLGFDLSDDVPQAKKLDGNTLLHELLGIESGLPLFKLDYALVTPGEPNSGRLSGDAAFEVSVEQGSESSQFRVVVDATSDNRTAENLVADINRSLGAAKPVGGGSTTLGELVRAELVDGRLQLVAQERSAAHPKRTTAIVVTTLESDPAFSELGFEESSRAELVLLEVRAQNALPASGLRLKQDAALELSIAREGDELERHTIVVRASETAQNTSIEDLLEDIRNGIASAGLANAIEVSSEGVLLGADFLPLLVLRARDTSVARLVLREASPLLGFTQRTPADEGKLEEVRLEAERDLVTLVGQLTGDAVFQVDFLDGRTATVTVAADATRERNPGKDGDTSFYDNRTLLDLIADVQAAIEETKLGGELVVSSEGSRLLFTRLAGPLNDLRGFSIKPLANADQLGLSGSVKIEANDADLLITTSDEKPLPVSLDDPNLQTLGDLMDAIHTQTHDRIVVTITEDDPTTPHDEGGTGLTLTDTGAGTSPSGRFRVALINGSTAALQLGIAGQDEDPADASDRADRMIVGTAIRGAKVLDRFYIAGLPPSAGSASTGGLEDVIDVEVGATAGALLSDLTIDSIRAESQSGILSASGFDFRRLNREAIEVGEFKIRIHAGPGFREGTYPITRVMDENTVEVAGTPGSTGARGGSGIFSGLQLSARFGPLGIDLTGVAHLDVKVGLGFNTGNDAVSDGRLSLAELVAGLGDPLSLLALPEFGPRDPNGPVGELSATLRLAPGSAKFEALAKQLIDLDDPHLLRIQVNSVGDPFLGQRLVRADYAPAANELSGNKFTMHGDFTEALAPISGPPVIRFRGPGFNGDVKVGRAEFDSTTGLTTVPVTPKDFDLPSLQALKGEEPGQEGKNVSVRLLPDIEVDTHGLSGDLKNFANLKLSDLLATLRLAADFLTEFEAFKFLSDVKLPLVNKSVHDLLGFGEDLARAIERLQNDPNSTLQQIEAQVNSAFGVDPVRLDEVFEILGRPRPPDTELFELGYDSERQRLTFDFTLGRAFRQSLDFELPGIDFGTTLSALGLDRLIDWSGAAGLSAKGAALLQLTLGFDLKDFSASAGDLTDRLLIFETSGLDTRLVIGGQDIGFQAGIGPFSVSIASIKGKPKPEDDHVAYIDIDAHANADLELDDDPETRLGSGRLVDVIEDLEPHFKGDLGGTIRGELPVFFPNTSTLAGLVKIGESYRPGAGTLGRDRELMILVSPGQEPPDDKVVIDVSPVVTAIRNTDFTQLDLFSNLFLSVDGLDLVLGGLQSLLDGRLGKIKIPLIGHELARGARFIEGLREDFIAPLRAGLEALRNPAAEFQDPDKNPISVVLFDLLGPEGAALLLAGKTPGKPSDAITLDTNLDEYLRDPKQVRQQDVFIEWGMQLGGVLTDQDLGIALDLGVPGLGLETEGELKLDIAWQLQLAFGLSFKDGFYLRIGDWDRDHNPKNDPSELLFEISASADAEIKATLGFLEATATSASREFFGTTHSTGVGVLFAVDLRNGSNSADDKLSFTEVGRLDVDVKVAARADAILDLRLGLNRKLIGGIAAAFPSLTGQFNLVWGVGHQETGGATLRERAQSSNLVALSGLGDAFARGLQLVELAKLELDLGSVVRDVLGPIVKQVQKFTQPLQPIVRFLTSPVPVIGKFVDLTWLDLAEYYGDIDASLIRKAAKIVRLVHDIAALGSEPGGIPLGEVIFVLQPPEDSLKGLVALADAEPPVKLGDAPRVKPAFETLEQFEALLEKIPNEQLKSTLKRLIADGKKEKSGSFVFRLFEDAKHILGLLRDVKAQVEELKDEVQSGLDALRTSDVTLVEYDIPRLFAQFEYASLYPILPPFLYAFAGLRAGVSFDSAVGVDTRGIREFVQSGFRNPELILDGFYISDSPALNGVDDPELVFFAALFAGVELNLGAARAGVEASLNFQLAFDLFDPDGDGRVRFPELAASFQNQLRSNKPSLAPLAIFDVHGDIFALLRAYLRIKLRFFKLSKDFRLFGPVTLLDYNLHFNRPPLLATEVEAPGGDADGDLVINAGKFAAQRMLGNASDVAEHFVISSAGRSGDVVKVQVRDGGGRDSLGGATRALEYKVKVGKRIVIDGGAGNDIFDLSGFTESGVRFEIDGGEGDDIIQLSNAATGMGTVFNTIRGGTGNDTITGSGGSDLVFGGLGSDVIDAGGGDDLVFGDDGMLDAGSVRGLVGSNDGADSVSGGAGRDILFGGGAGDRIDGGTSDDADLIVSGGALALLSDPSRLPTFANLVALERGGVTETENAALDAGSSDTVRGGGGGDIIFGSGGADQLEGSAANDIIMGLGGPDAINGLAGDDLLFGDGGKLLAIGGTRTGGAGSTTTVLHDAGAHFLADGVRPGQFARNRRDGTFVRVLQVTSDTELRTAPAGNWASADYSFFAAVRADSVDDGGDRIQGNQGNDLIFAGGGADAIQGGAGDDEIYGGSGADRIDGDFSQDFPEELPQDPEKPQPFAPANAGGNEGGDRIFGEADADVLFGSGGDDLLDGGVGSDQLSGGAGDDSLIANKGSDSVDGEAGSDRFSVVFQGGTAVSLINIFDTGTNPDDFDVFVAEGTFFDDQFLLRSNTAGSISFVALINGDRSAERANYLGVESITLNAGFGDDRVAVDDTTAQITINGEQGKDFFQVGQLFKSSRSVDFKDESPKDQRDDETGIRLDDAFGTVETTRGFLSNGIRAPMTINGGEDNDQFVVFRNLAVLTLRGDDGEDVFEVRAFALVGSEEPRRERTDITGGAGADLVQYAVNAPVNINGGDGLDTVIILGSEFGDDFVITDEGVFGAGLNVNFVNVELLRVDGSEGDDRFFVQSTKETFVTELFGGLGSDTFSMSGDAPPVVSNDLRGHSGLILHDVESADPRFGDQHLYGISANIGDNDEPFVVVRETGGSTIISETDLIFPDDYRDDLMAAIFDSYQLVLTRRPDRDVIIRAQAPLPTPDERERGQRGFRVATVDKPRGSTDDGRAVTLEFTVDDWFLPQTVFVLADNQNLSDKKDIPLFTRPELSGWVPDFQMNDDAFEGLAFGVVSHIVESADPTKQVEAKFSNLDSTGVRLTIAAPASATAEDLLGRALVITKFEGVGQSRFIVGVDATSTAGSFVLTLDRPFDEGARPIANQSEFLVRVTDAITGKVSSIDPHPTGLPPSTLAEDRRTTLTAVATEFPVDGPGLTGATLEIVGGAGQGQRRLIVGHLATDATHTLILGDGWTRAPDATSVFRIERFDGLQIPGVEVTIHDDDRPGLIVDPTSAFAKDGDRVGTPADLVADSDTITAVIEGGDGDHLGERDVLRIRLNRDPGATGATVALGYDAKQLQLTDLAGQPLKELQFTDANSSAPQTVAVRALADGRREGFHSSLIEFTVTAGSRDTRDTVATDDFDLIPEEEAVFFLGLRQVASHVTSVVHDGQTLLEGRDFTVQGNRILFQTRAGTSQKIFGKVVVSYQYTDPGFLSSTTRPVLARIQDADAPTVLVRQSGGSTDVTEIASSLPATERDAAADAYELVLTGKPTAPVTVTVTPAITKTTRAGGLRSDAVQLSIAGADPSDARVRPEVREGVPTGNLLVTFDDQNWDDPVRVEVAAIDDGVVDGGDTQVFAPGPRTLSQILGPVFVEGSGGRGSLSIQDPVLLPLETNLRRVDGRVLGFTPNVSDGPGAVEEMVVEKKVLDDKVAELDLLSVQDLVGETIEISRGRGVGVVLEPKQPELKFDRFWRIRRIQELPDDPSRLVLTLQNPTLVDPAKLAANDVPTASDDPATAGDDTSSFTITSLSANFFVDESLQVDVMFVNDQDSPADSRGVLTSTNLSGLNMGPEIVIGGVRQPGGITYTDLEVLDISLGTGGNTFDVLGTPTRTDGFQTWTILRTGDDIPFDRGTSDPSDDIGGDRVTVRLNREKQPELTGTIESTMSSGQGTADSPPAVDSSVVVKLDASFGPLGEDALVGYVLHLTGAGEGPSAAERRILHSDATQGGGTRIVLDSNWDDDPTGREISIENPIDGAFAVDTQGGDDVVDATGSTQNLYIFGGTGKDTLIGGSGDDVIFGDRGRIDFNDAAGTVVTRLGTALVPITGFVSSQRSVDRNDDAQPDASELTDLGPTLSGGVLIPGFPLPDLLDDGLGNDDIGLRGLSLDINNGRGFAQPPLVIADNDLRTLRLAGLFDQTLDLPGAEANGAVVSAVNGEVDGAPPTTIMLDRTFATGSLRSKAIRLGDGQLRRILDNSGAELTVSGPWETLPTAGSSYLILSSEYRISTLPEDQTDGVVRGPSLLLTIDTELGGDDLIDAGAGADQIFGGAGADTIRAGTGDDLIAGDGARVDRTIDPTLPAPDVEFDPSRSSLEDPVKAGTFLERMRSIAWNVGGNDEITGAPGADLILGGAGEDRLYGDDAAGSSGTADGADVIAGDNGEIDFDALGRPLRIFTVGSAFGGADVITGNAGNDILFGGAGGDTITGASGENILFGDHGELRLQPVTALNAGASNPFRGVVTVFSTDAAAGGSDTITSGNQNDIAFGGAGADTIQVGDGENIALGDDGRANFSDGWLVGLESTDPAVGGSDQITGGRQRDVMVGGQGGDLLSAGGADDFSSDIALGDNGSLVLLPGNILVSATTTFPDQGGDDDIRTGNGSDVVLGGARNDLIDAGSDAAQDIVLGDNGEALFSAAGLLRQISSANPGTGGNDRIRTGAGNDVVIGGDAGDDIETGIADAGQDIVMGDHAIAHFDARQELLDIESLFPSSGGSDRIATGNGRDVVFGGSGDDVIDAEGPDVAVLENSTGNDDAPDLVVGDHGRATFQGTASFDPGEQIRTLSFNFGSENGFFAKDTAVTGPAGAPGARAGNWLNLEAGSGFYGDQSDERVGFDDGNTAVGVTVRWGTDLQTDPRDANTDTHLQIEPATEDQRMFEGYLYSSSSRALQAEITGLGGYFAAYDVCVYVDGDNFASASTRSVRSISDGKTTYYLDDPDGNHFVGQYVQVTATDPLQSRPGNYVVFRGLTSDRVSLTVAAEGPSSQNRPVLNGIQVVGRLFPIDRVETRFEQFAGSDTIRTGGGSDLVLGGAGSDLISTFGNAAEGARDGDIVAGDNARATLVAGVVVRLESKVLGQVLAPDPTFELRTAQGNDTIRTGNGEDVVLGGFGNDDIDTGIAGVFDNGNIRVLSLNFGSNASEAALTGVAGAVQVDHWNNLANTSHDRFPFSEPPDSATGLVFNDGTSASGIDVIWGRRFETRQPRATSDGTHAGIDPSTQNEALFEGMITTDADDTLGVNLRGLSAHFGSAYDVYVYLDDDNGGQSNERLARRISDGRTTFLLSDPRGNTFQGHFVEVTSTTAVPGVVPQVGNYVVFRNVTGDTFSLRVDDERENFFGANRPTIAAIQVVGGPDRGKVTIGGDFDEDVALGDEGVARFFAGVLHQIETIAPVGGILGDADTLRGGEDVDLLAGGNGSDDVRGEEGNDVLFGDQVRLRLYGGDLNETLLLNDAIGGDDRLEGGAHDDLLYGQFGQDSFVFAGRGLGSDTAIEAEPDSGNDAHDTLDFADFGAPVDVSLSTSATQFIGGITDGQRDLRLNLSSGSAFEDIIGSAFGDVLVGSFRPNTLSGRGGADVLAGLSGDDVLLGGANDDILLGGRDEDLIDGGLGDDLIAGDWTPGNFWLLRDFPFPDLLGEIFNDHDHDQRDVILGGEGNDVIDSGDGRDLVDGEAGDDFIFGGFGDDVLLGGDGADRIDGEFGDDILEGGLGDDRLRSGVVMQQEQGATPLGIGNLLTQFAQRFSQGGFSPVDPTPTDGNDRPLRPWLQPFLDGAVRPRPVGHLGSNPPDAAELVVPPSPPQPGTRGADVQIARTAVLEAGVVLGDRVRVMPRATIGAGTFIGRDVTIGAGAKIGAGARIGDGVEIQAGAVIPNGSVVLAGKTVGAPGSAGGRWARIPELRERLRGLYPDSRTSRV